MKPKILVVDDDADLLAMMRLGLEEYSGRFDLLTAGNGHEALEILKSEKITLVITDLMMPMMDGFQLLTEMMANFPEIPRMVVSAANSNASQQMADACEVREFLVKPVSPKTLGECILHALEKSPTESGFVTGISLASFTQLVSLEQKDCTLDVSNQESGELATFFFRSGQLLDVSLNGDRGMDVACKALNWKSVKIAIRDGCPEMADSIRTPIDALLMEAAYRSDTDSLKVDAPGEMPDLESLPAIRGKSTPTGEQSSNEQSSNEQPPGDQPTGEQSIEEHERALEAALSPTYLSLREQQEPQLQPEASGEETGRQIDGLLRQLTFSQHPHDPRKPTSQRQLLRKRSLGCPPRRRRPDRGSGVPRGVGQPHRLRRA